MTDPITETVARAIYETDPHYESGEYVDGFQVSPGGNLSWERALARDAEFEGDRTMLPFTAWAFQAAQAAIAAHKAALSTAGLVIVPRIPTEAMVNAPELGMFFGGVDVDHYYADAATHTWASMIAAFEKEGT